MININKNCALIRSCKITIPINVRQRKQFFRKKLLASNNNVLPLCSKTMIFLIPVFLLDNCDFLFYPTTQANFILYINIIDYMTIKILVNNTFNYLLRILRHQKLAHIVDIYYKNCFLVDALATFNSAAFPMRV